MGVGVSYLQRMLILRLTVRRVALGNISFEQGCTLRGSLTSSTEPLGSALDSNAESTCPAMWESGFRSADSGNVERFFLCLESSACQRQERTRCLAWHIVPLVPLSIIESTSSFVEARNS